MLIFMMVFIFTAAYYRDKFNIKSYNNTKSLTKLFNKVDKLENNKIDAKLRTVRILDQNLFIDLSNHLFEKEKEIDLLFFKYEIYRADYDKFYDLLEREHFKMYIKLLKKNAFKK